MFRQFLRFRAVRPGGRGGHPHFRTGGPKRDVAMASPEVLDRRVGYRRIVHPQTGAWLDKAVVLFFAGPASETGEDVAEFQVHGGRAVVTAVLAALSQIPGCRMAEPGEFARRAFNNGKLNLVEVEALADLVDAETEAQRRLALRSGAVLSGLYEGWRTRLIEIAALTEAAIDFSDEGDVSASSIEAARQRAKPLEREIQRHLDDGHRGEIVREGFRVALLGPPNAGKSSLLNALARRNAAIVSEEAGTTRDVIEVRLDLDGYPVIVSDTAGIRETEGLVEREGIRRSLAAARDANLNLWLSETGSDQPPEPISRETVLLVRTKADLAESPLPVLRGERARGPGIYFSRGEKVPEGGMRGFSTDAGVWESPSPVPTGHPLPTGEGNSEPYLPISTKTGVGIDHLIRLIAARAASAMSVETEAPVVARARHRQHLEQAVSSLGDFLSGSTDDVELRAEDIRRAAHALGRITGRVDVEDVLGQIFSQFCIGK